MHCPHINLGPLHMRWDHWVSCRCTGSIKLYVSLFVCVCVSERAWVVGRDGTGGRVGMSLWACRFAQTLSFPGFAYNTWWHLLSTRKPVLQIHWNLQASFLPFLVVQMPLCFLSLKHFCGFRISFSPPFFFLSFFFKPPSCLALFVWPCWSCFWPTVHLSPPPFSRQMLFKCAMSRSPRAR